MNDYVEFTSLCSVWTDSYDQIWLTRIADLKNGVLDLPVIDDTLPRIFANRDRIFYRNGPAQDDTIGIWRWSAGPNNSDPAKDYIKSEYQSNLHPVRFVQVKNISTLEELSKRLLLGVASHRYTCDTFFAYEKKSGMYEGLLCEAKDLILGDKIYLKKDICFLPIYQFKQTDIIAKNGMRFIKFVPLPAASGRLSIGGLNENLKSIFLDRMTWPLYKDCIGRTKAEWRNCKTLFERVCDKSLYEAVADKLGCTFDEAIKLVQDFTNRANSLFAAGDIDSDVLAQIVINNDELRAQCEAAVEEHWKASHAEQIVAAQAEIDAKRQAAETISDKYKVQLDKIQADTAAAEATRQKILTETAEAQVKLDRLLKEIEEYEVLGDNTVQAVQNKISAAQQDIAGFIADLSIFMPQQSIQRNTACDTQPSNRWTFTHGVICNDADTTEECRSWKDTRLLLCENLRLAGVGTKWTDMFSAFLYSAYLNRMPLLLAGPNAESIADALSMTIYGKKIDILRCCGEQDSDAISCFGNSNMAAVQNPFQAEWISCTSQQSTGFALWLHPFTEDLQIEPRSLYHYAYPVFTECFIDEIPSMENMDAGRKADKYTEFESNSNYRAKMGHIKKLHISRLMFNRLEKVLTDAKCMGDISDTRMEYLFGMLPLCVLSGEQEVLSELLDNDRSITPAVKTELQRYIEE